MALAAMPDAGVIQLGDRRTTIKFASERTTGSGRLVTVLAAQPIVFVGAGLPNEQPRAGFDVALAFLDLQDTGGIGELAPAAKVGIARVAASAAETRPILVLSVKSISITSEVIVLVSCC